MTFLNSVYILVFTTLVSKTVISDPKSKIRVSHDAICNEMIRYPFFEEKIVVGQPWRVYYTWNMKLDEFCMEFTFKYADPLKVDRLKLDIEQMKIKPPRSKEVLLISVSLSPDMMLFNDVSGVQGLFVGMVPQVEGRRKVLQKTHKMALKLLQGGRYLLMSDCSFGTTSLSIHKDNRPNREEIKAVAANFTFVNAFPACTLEPDLDV